MFEVFGGVFFDAMRLEKGVEFVARGDAQERTDLVAGEAAFAVGFEGGTGGVLGVRLETVALLVDLAPVRYLCHIDGSSRVVYYLNYPVSADANPPLTIAALELLAARRARCRREMFEAWYYAGDQFCG